MKKAYILHGTGNKDKFDKYPSPSNDHWIPWLQRELVMRGYNCQTPEVPMPHKAPYKDWKDIFDIYPVDRETTLIGHSAGAGFFLRWLGENKRHIGRLFLIGPWLDPKRTMGDFLNFTLSPDLPKQVDEIHVFYSTDDPAEGIKESADLILKTYPKAKIHRFENLGHFFYGSTAPRNRYEFPELLPML